MRYGSVCSGIEAATVAWHPLGWSPDWFAEIDPFCCALLKHHYPTVENHGDFTKIERSEPIDVMVGGTPCQDFSVAGLRAGMDGARGQLTTEFLNLAGRIRPRWVVWENVPGILSIDGGRAFGAFLGRLGQCGYGFAYRVLDAQYFGVPQRRRRVFVVGYLGDWWRAAAVLFERACLSGNPAPSREAGEDVALYLSTSAERYDAESESFAIASHGGYNDGLGTLRASGGDYSGGSEMLVANPLAGHHGRDDLDNDTYVTHSLRADGFDASEDGTGRGTPLVGQTLRTDKMPAVSYGSGVRRLTPRECERLQGFPDDYTLISYRGKSASDGPRYRALGNSMAVPVMRWIGRRIEIGEAICAAVERRAEERGTIRARCHFSFTTPTLQSK